MYDRVLYPTDGSEGADVATEHALEHARRFDASMHALYVVDTSVHLGNDAFSGPAYEAMKVTGGEQVDRVTERAREAGVEATKTVVEGTPATAIVEEADDGDVIVMGTHGRSGLDRYLIGSTTEKVVRAADVPVVTIPVYDVSAPEEKEDSA